MKDLEIVDGAVRVVGTDKKITFADIAKLPNVAKEDKEGNGSFVPPDATYPNGTHVAEVEIDPETGVTEIVRYTICDDFGIAVNPLLDSVVVPAAAALMVVVGLAGVVAVLLYYFFHDF